jgi:hypothetical protein
MFGAGEVGRVGRLCVGKDFFDVVVAAVLADVHEQLALALVTHMLCWS